MKQLHLLALLVAAAVVSVSAAVVRADVWGTADVTPNQAWSEDGTAYVTPRAPFPETETRLLPLEHRPLAAYTIYRSEYPNGLVIVFSSETLSGTVPFPVIGGGGASITDDRDTHQEIPDGVVFWFFN